MRPRPTLVAAVLALALLAAPTHAAADYDPVGSGATRLQLDRSFLALLKREGVGLAAVKPAKLKGGVVSFPASGGKFDPTTAEGMVDHEGSLVFSAGRRKLPLRALMLKTTQRRAPLSAKVGGSQLKLASAGKLTVARQGFGNRTEVRALELSAKFAGRLGKKLRLPDAFAAGQPLGQTVTRAEPQTVAIEGTRRVSFTFAPEIEAKLHSLFVAVNPIFPAEHIGAEFQLPIFDGKLAPDASSGSLETEGRLELLQLGGGQVFWGEPKLDLEAGTVTAEVEIQPAPPYPGKVGRVPIAALGVVAARRSSNSKQRTITVEGAALALSTEQAAAFNQAFAEGKEVFRTGEPLGSLSFVAQAQ